MSLANANYLKGAACGLGVAAIAAGWSAMTRLAVSTDLDAWDVVALRFGLAGLLLAPVAARKGLALERLGWHGLAALLAGGGVPYVLAAAAGLRFAPAHDQAALNPGCTPLFVALFAAGLLGERFTLARKLGLAFIVTGAALLVGWQALAGAGTRTLGHALFLTAALLWAGFTLVMRQARLQPLHAAALVATGSSVLYLPGYLALRGGALLQMPPVDLAIQAAYQGVLVTVVLLLLYGRAIALLGASAASAFLALVPALSALIAMPLLAESPSPGDWLGLALISLGVYLASGGPLPLRRGAGNCPPRRHAPA